MLRGTPHTAILGNHDAEPFNHTANQSEPGAKTNRTALMEHDAALATSYSAVGPVGLRPAVSIFVVDVFGALLLSFGRPSPRSSL